MLTGKQFGRYEIRSKIGEGGMGEVYAAHDTELDRKIAVKLLPSEFTTDEDRRARFKQEARIISALNHPNIITIYEIGENEHGSYLVTEYVEGRTLRDVTRNDSLTVPKILRIIEQAARALVAAHAAKIIHRDVKPENIMVRGDGIVKVLDFGLAKPGANMGGEDNKTIPGTVMGSARYMSPEQARGREVDERTDIWSIGVVLYELLTGRAAFDGETPTDTLADVIYKEPEPIGHLLPNLPIELQRIIRKALQKDRDERYQSMKDLALDLKDLLYDLEHANSGDRLGHTTSSPEFSESRTMIHTTSGSNFTNTKDAVTRISEPDHVTTGSKRSLIFGLASVAVVALLGVGIIRWFGGGPAPMSQNAFDRTQIARVNTDGKVNLPVISPDGKYVAYVAGELGRRSLVVRQLATDSLITVIPPTNLNFSAVSFSPTGDHIYYCETRSDFSVNTLYQVPTLGGSPKKLIEDVDSTVTFSPDGKQFVFVRHTSRDNDSLLMVADAATLQTQQLATARGSGYDFFSARPAWSPDGRVILIGGGKRQAGSVSEIAIGEVSVAGKTFRSLSGGEFFSSGNFAWFADGSGFVFTAREIQTAPTQIWRASYPGLEFRQVTNDFNDYLEVGLAADGKTILTLKGDLNATVWRMPADSREMLQLTADSRNPEGMLGLAQNSSAGPLLFTRREGKDAKIWMSDADGRNARALGPDSGTAVGPLLSADGRYIYYNLQKPQSSRIWRMDADGKNHVQLTDDGDHGDYNPQLMPDGNTLIFQRQITNSDRAELFKISAAGGPITPFHSEPFHNLWSARISPDGTRIAYSTYDIRSYDRKIVLAKLNSNEFGGVEREFEYNLIHQMAWTPDGKSLTYLSSRSGTPNLWTQPIDGSPVMPLTDFKSGQIFNFAWSGDGKNILLARGTINNDLLLIRDAVRAERGEVAKKRSSIWARFLAG